MRINKYSKLYPVFSFLAYLLLPGISYASGLCPEGYESLCQLAPQNSGPGSLVAGIIQILLLTAIVVAALFLVLAGIKYIMSGGDKGKIDEARKQIIASIIGLLIALLAYFVVNLLVYFFTGGDVRDLKLPKFFD